MTKIDALKQILAATPALNRIHDHQDRWALAILPVLDLRWTLVEVRALEQLVLLNALVQ